MLPKKVKRGFWEIIFDYPSFNKRFAFIIIVAAFIFCVISYFLLFKVEIFETISDKISVFNSIVQMATLVLGIFAAYYALRQLVETRFTSLDEAGMQELKHKHYGRAFEKWREALYIRPDAYTLTNMFESLLLIGDYKTFDIYTGTLYHKEIFQEIHDQIILLYLKTVRHLLVKNQGEAEIYLREIVSIVRQESLSGFSWDFLDLKTSETYQNFQQGECKNILDNLISYLEGTIQPLRKKEFEEGQFASQAEEKLEVPAVLEIAR